MLPLGHKHPKNDGAGVGLKRTRSSTPDPYLPELRLVTSRERPGETQAEAKAGSGAKSALGEGSVPGSRPHTDMPNPSLWCIRAKSEARSLNAMPKNLRLPLPTLLGNNLKRWRNDPPEGR